MLDDSHFAYFSQVSHHAQRENCKNVERLLTHSWSQQAGHDGTHHAK